MSIKKSSLESKWYYRVGKVILMLLPFVVIALLFIYGKLHIADLPKSNIFTWSGKTLSTFLQKNFNLFYIVGGAVIYLFLLKGIVRIILYVGFGGLENDMEKPNKECHLQPIKQSTLEKNIYYRIGKSLMLLLPFVVILLSFILKKVHIVTLPIKGITSLSSKYITDFLQQNMFIVYMALSLIAYYIILHILRRITLYIGFGGLENDTKRKVRRSFSAGGVAVPQQQSNNDGGLGLLFLLILIIIIATYGSQTSTSITTPGGITIPKKSQCIPTGCGNLWRSYCTNSCYSTKSDCMLAGSRCSSNMCRQCP